MSSHPKSGEHKVRPYASFQPYRQPRNHQPGFVGSPGQALVDGAGQIAELVWQLRGEAEGRQIARARVALAQNSGGWLEGDSAAGVATVLAR